jgi:hypothetical protein
LNFGNVECDCMLCSTWHYAIKTQLIRNVNKFDMATFFIFPIPFTQVPMKFNDDYGLKLCLKQLNLPYIIYGSPSAKNPEIFLKV